MASKSMQQGTHEGIGSVQTSSVRVETTEMRATQRLAGFTMIGGALTMIAGAILWGTSGTDLWAAVPPGDMAGYLTAVGAIKPQLIANLSLWILGTLILGIAYRLLADLCRQRRHVAQMILASNSTAIPLVVVSYIIMLVLVVQIAPDTSATSVAIANALGWVGLRADDLATIFVLGTSPFFVAWAARGEWLPGWAVIWGYVCGVVGLLSLLPLYMPDAGLTILMYLILPVGLLWLIAVGATLLRRP